MKPLRRLSACALLLLFAACRSDGGNILVWYTDGSHWINMKPILNALVDRGHEVTVLVPNVSMYMNGSEPSRFRYEPFTVPVSKEEMQASLGEFLHFFMYEIDAMNYLQMYEKAIRLQIRQIRNFLKHLDGVVKSDTIERLKKGKYDLVFADPVYPGSDLTADILGIPLVFSVCLPWGNKWERHCGQLPAPPSFVPATMSKLTDRMNFFERMWNFLFYSLHDVLLEFTYWQEISRYYSEIKGTPTDACKMMSRADLWLMRNYWDFDFPRPFLPNFIFLGGVHCQPAKPLPKDMEEFVQSSEDDGIVVFSLGSMINNMTREKGNTMATALAQIPQKVLWRYKGKRPETLGPNTRIYEWLPQNDLLGHSKTRAFITHAGINGITEAIYHGVPVVGIPLFGEQADNMVHMVARGAGTTLDLNTMTAEHLRDAINTVISDQSYKENAMRLSRIHHDRPMKPLDEVVFWLEYVIRHKGAKHLRVQSHELTWYQYYSLDVLAFLLSIVALLTLLFVKSCQFCFRRSCGRTANTKAKAE
ncbi:UDP-glucuronosyltransferase 2C1-like [Nelusetta ayraudi]|uniref:UDP-glucuronosyltransferase 2C1-like n=1 Tax=Nelusetta ayraudi TaxID=303726 RepID=UPI003F72B574